MEADAPWTIHEWNTWFSIRDAGGATVASIPARRDDQEIALQIAALPDLLAALVRLKNCPDLFLESLEDESIAALEQADAALAKAGVTSSHETP